MFGHNSCNSHVIITPARPFNKCLKEIDAKHLYDQQSNPPLDCCRNIDNLTLEIRKTNKDIKKPDLYIARCTCGAEHPRLKVDPANLSMFMTKGEEDE